jgi:CubicO group peptidase (beta-lactamase class C family)
MTSTTSAIAAALDAAAIESGFAGVTRVDADATPVFSQGYGLADRANAIPNTATTRFAVASVTKGFTACAIGALIDDGLLALDTPVRPILGDDLPLIDGAVTVGHLLSHTSGIGDYLDEDGDSEMTDYAMTVPLHNLASPEGYLPTLDGRPQVTAPGEAFKYNNSAFVVLALIIERVSGASYFDFLAARVFAPAGMTSTGFPRSDAPEPGVAVGYLFPANATEGDGEPVDPRRTNVLHVPLRGLGDGGAFTTAEDLARFWTAFAAGRIVTPETLALLTAPLDLDTDDDLGYGHGFWLTPNGPAMVLVGFDAGISAQTWHNPADGTTVSVISNDTYGIWDVLEALDFTADDGPVVAEKDDSEPDEG